VLKPVRKLIVIAANYKKGACNMLQRPAMKLLKSTDLDVDAHRGLFSTAGYTDIQIFEENTKDWICGIGKEPL
jgi:hypothetical protein